MTRDGRRSDDDDTFTTRTGDPDVIDKYCKIFHIHSAIKMMYAVYCLSLRPTLKENVLKRLGFGDGVGWQT